MFIHIASSIFFVLHGLVHLLYFGQSARYFELQPGMVWPDGAWAFSAFAGGKTIRRLASVLLVLAAIGFAAGGAGVLIQQTWWRPVVVSAAAFSTVIYILLWDGKLQKLHDKGGVGILINTAIMVVLLIFQ